KREPDSSDFVGSRGALEGCTKSGCGESQPVCFARLSSRCVAIATESNSKTSRWYHLSRWEHYCNACFELCYRGRLANEWAPSWVAQLRSAWLRAECRQPSPRELLANAALPYWASCRDCGRWRQLDTGSDCNSDNDYNLLPRRLLEFRCSNCDEPEHPGVAWAASDPDFLSSLAVPVLLQDNCCRRLLLFDSKLYGCRPLSVGLAPLPGDQLIDSPSQLHPFASGLFSFGQSSAASSSRSALSVRPDQVDPDELAAAYPAGQLELRNQPQLYLAVRNTLLAAWAIWHSTLAQSSSRTPADWPTIADSRRSESLILCRGLARIRICSAILPAIIRRLERLGLINFGVRPVAPDAADGDDGDSDDASVADVVIFGDDIAGLAAARQLVNFGRRVVLIESTNNDDKDNDKGNSRRRRRLPDVAVVDSVSNNPLCLMALQRGIGHSGVLSLEDNPLLNVDLFDWPDGGRIAVESDVVCQAVDVVTEALTAASAKRVYASARRKARATGSEAVSFFVESDAANYDATGSKSIPTGSEAYPTGSEANPTGSESNHTGTEANPTGTEANPTGSEANPTGSEPNSTGSKSNPTAKESNLTENSSNPTGFVSAPIESDDVSVSTQIDEQSLLDAMTASSEQGARLLNFYLASLEYRLGAPLNLVSAASTLPFERDKILPQLSDNSAIVEVDTLADLADWLAAGSRTVPLLCGSAVARICRRPAASSTSPDAGVEVSLTDGRRIRAACCLLTLPLTPSGLLTGDDNDGPKFEPPLPSSKLRAADAHGCCRLSTLRLRFRRRFWLPSRCFATLPESSTSRGICHLFVDPSPVAGDNSPSTSSAFPLLAIFCGKAVEHLAAQADPLGYATREAARRLAVIFGESAEPPVDSSLSSWSAAYPAAGRWSPTGDAEFADALSADVGCSSGGDCDGDGDAGPLFFAGEAASKEFPHSLTGACVSGLAAAGRVADWLDARSRRVLLRAEQRC
ncbi:hypothetical protein BOX15_Mlig019979g2, partial [Macrostomum lignano]